MRRTIREVEPVKPSTRLTQERERKGMKKWSAPSAPSPPAPGGEGRREEGRSRVEGAPLPSPLTARPSQGEGEAARRATRETKELINLLRGDLDWIVMKCLEKDRNRRYETANGLASDIQRHLNNEPVVACPPSNLYRFQKLVRRNKLAVGAARA